ncbi:hypothetical protein NL676_026701 [Syzygium grande]|nr:hypothetical protein NL676_026701 [Syzygium grande]
MFDSVKSHSLLLHAVLLIYSVSISFSHGGSHLHHSQTAHFPKIAVSAQFDVVLWEERKLVLEGNDDGSLQNSTQVLAEKRTGRRDPLDNFRHYKGGWNISSRPYLFKIGCRHYCSYDAPLGFTWLLSIGVRSSATCVPEWRKCICEVSANNLCTSVGRFTTVFYDQMMAIVNASYGLYH